MGKKICVFLREENVWASLVASLGIAMITALIGFCVWASRQPTTVVIQTKSGPMTKTYYGSLDSVAAQEGRDEAIARAEIQWRSPKEENH